MPDQLYLAKKDLTRPKGFAYSVSNSPPAQPA